MLLELATGNRLVFTANHPNNPINEDKIDWSRVSRVKILRIETSNG